MTLIQAATEKSYLNRPKAIGIKVRKPSFNPKAIRRHFFANSPIMSHLLTALSSTFPIGEQFFVHSVRNVRDKVKDEKLQAEIAAFIGQEAMHSKAHADFNDAWRRDDYNLDSFQAWLARREKFIQSVHPKFQLAITCAFEHFTALLGGYVLRHPEILSTLDDDAIKLWVWHAIEEIEHRAVAFDVYQAVYKDDQVRRSVMRNVTTGFASLTFYSASRLFMQDWRKSLPKVTGNLYGTYMILKMLVSLIPEYMSYFKADFHPSEIDYSKIVEYWKERLADEYGMESFQESNHQPLYS
ncbi:metal-dependent hydrolase [Acinetobacter sp. ANC 4648]|uniref:metal-dependent hydrolase n=1 Tax=Acinetobacter sp. ANC 4648 TaxID=1977875 RepID=UPI000A33092A|nr:metal-dependent hydrolase [Acinetobacter sp. ANC 4648]OTG84926.1 metal-dependent hydrolase [Acinetobacter sp. ANC 4648]